MDERTIRILEFPKIRDGLAGKAVTAAGRERAETLLPAVDAHAVRSGLDETGEAIALMAGAEVPLRGTSDIRDALQRAAIGSTLDPQDLLGIQDTLHTMRQCKGFVQARAEQAPGLADLARSMGTFEGLENAIQRTVADDGSIPDSASSDLGRIRRERRITHTRMREKLEDLVRGQYARMLQDPIITSRGDRYVVPVRQEFKGAFPGLLHDQSSSGATAFMEPLAVVPLGNRLRELEIEEREEIARLLRELSERIGEASPEIRRSYEALGQVDFAVAKALLAEAMRATKPALREDGALKFLQARHPLLTGGVVPIDVRLGDEFTTLVITGPNTGGKTVTLKTLGLLTLMAQAGLYVPAAEGSEAAVFPQVFADIGDEQSIEQSLSTFSSHMGAIVGILKQVQRRALVLLDEIGAGTDPTEGVALARALIERLHAREIRTVVTTHYNELKSLAYTHQGIQNASVEFDTETLRPTYRLLIGLPGRSNALVIASRLGLDPAVVEKARRLLGTKAVEIDRILTDIEADRKAYEFELAQAGRLREEADTLRLRSEGELERLRTERKKILARVREDAEAMLARARREVDAIIERLRGAGTVPSVQEARASLGRLREELERAAEVPEAEEGEPLTDAQPGQPVFIVSLRRAGTVLTAPDPKGEVEVEAGGMRVKVGLAGLRTSAPPRESSPADGLLRQGDISIAEPVPMSLSLRGDRVDEAIPKLDKYLDEAFVARLAKVTIIHGKGTGALRKAVHEFLSRHPYVKAYRLGERGEGEAGATVVELDVMA